MARSSQSLGEGKGTHMRAFVFSWVFLGAVAAQAQVHSPTSQEINVSYEATFLARDFDDEPEEAAQLHASHVFGLFHSPVFTRSFGINPKKIEGVGAPRLPNKIKILDTDLVEDDGTGESRLKITYSLSGKFLVHRNVARAWLKKGTASLLLPYDLSKIYDKKCTDAHYTDIGDYWYFYDIYRRGCTRLQKAPFSKKVQLTVTPSGSGRVEKNFLLSKLRGDNGNGSVFSVSIIHGFESDTRKRRDEGRVGFEQMNKMFLNKGFARDVIRSEFTRPLHLYTKSVEGPNGEAIDIEIRHLLVDSAIESRSVTFAKFMKEAVKNADVILYAGHSGLGGNMDIPSLEEKAGAFEFAQDKKQLFFFDSCSSYAYYLDHFLGEKNAKSKIDILSYGLSSYFHTSPGVHEAFFDLLFDPATPNAPWSDVLEQLEAPLEGGSYLLSVGGV